VLLLLAQGHAPEVIRIIDFRNPARDDMLETAKGVSFARADISSEASTAAAFSQPWAPAVAKLPLTVFHTAAVIRPSERSPLVYDRCARVNVAGTAHCLSAARAVGASIFIATSSCSVALLPVTWWFAPWKKWPGRYTQVITEADYRQPMKAPNMFFANYARSKAESERLVCRADDERHGFRTGAIRPGSAVYGHKDDFTVGPALKIGSFPTFTAPWMQNWIHAGNAALGHLKYEAALLGPHAGKVAGRPFLVTDPGPPLVFQDFYTLIGSVSKTRMTVHYPPPVLLLMVAQIVEAYCVLLLKVPLLTKFGLREPQPPLYYLQPGCFDASTNCILDDSEAKRPVLEGGIGYRGVCGTLDGLCMQIRDWNRFVERERALGRVVGEPVDGFSLKPTVASTRT
jgi:nucleoside-diphosphate-sugar epimerase